MGLCVSQLGACHMYARCPMLAIVNHVIVSFFSLFVDMTALQGTDVGTVTPVRLDSQCSVAFETNFHGGVRRETLRSLAQCANTTAFPLQVYALACPICLSVQRFVPCSCNIVGCCCPPPPPLPPFSLWCAVHVSI